MITVEVWLYGPLTQYSPVQSKSGYARVDLSLPEGSTMRDLINHFRIPSREKGITFVNGDLTDMPGLAADSNRILHDGDRIGLMHNRSMWPFQYRHMAKTSPELRKKLDRGAGGGVFHSARRRPSADEGR